MYTYTPYKPIKANPFSLERRLIKTQSWTNQGRETFRRQNDTGSKQNEKLVQA